MCLCVCYFFAHQVLRKIDIRYNMIKAEKIIQQLHLMDFPGKAQQTVKKKKSR